MSQLNRPLNGAIVVAFLFIFVFSLNSCSVSRVLKEDVPSANSAGSGQKFSNDTIVRMSMWNGRNGKQDILSLCPNGISRVKIITKPMDLVVGFFTIGFVVKQRIEWDCSQRSGSEEL